MLYQTQSAVTPDMEILRNRCSTFAAFCDRYSTTISRFSDVDPVVLKRQAENLSSMASNMRGGGARVVDLKLASRELALAILATEHDWSRFLTSLCVAYPVLRSDHYLSDTWTSAKTLFDVAALLLLFYVDVVRNGYYESYHFISQLGRRESSLLKENILTWSELSTMFEAHKLPFPGAHLEAAPKEIRDLISNREDWNRLGDDPLLNVYRTSHLALFALRAGQLERSLTPLDLLWFQTEVYSRRPFSSFIPPNIDAPHEAVASLMSTTQLMPVDMVLLRDPKANSSYEIGGQSVADLFVDKAGFYGLKVFDNYSKVRGINDAAAHFESLRASRNGPTQ